MNVLITHLCATIYTNGELWEPSGDRLGEANKFCNCFTQTRAKIIVTIIHTPSQNPDPEQKAGWLWFTIP